MRAIARRRAESAVLRVREAGDFLLDFVPQYDTYIVTLLTV